MTYEYVKGVGYPVKLLAIGTQYVQRRRYCEEVVASVSHLQLHQRLLLWPSTSTSSSALRSSGILLGLAHVHRARSIAVGLAHVHRAATAAAAAAIAATIAASAASVTTAAAAEWEEHGHPLRVDGHVLGVEDAEDDRIERAAVALKPLPHRRESNGSRLLDRVAKDAGRYAAQRDAARTDRLCTIQRGGVRRREHGGLHADRTDGMEDVRCVQTKAEGHSCIARCAAVGVAAGEEGEAARGEEKREYERGGEERIREKERERERERRLVRTTATTATHAQQRRTHAQHAFLRSGPAAL